MNSKSIIARIIDVLQEDLPGLKVGEYQEDSPYGGVRFIARMRSKKFLFEVKELAQLRMQHLFGQLALASLEAKKIARQHKALPVVAVIAPRIGQKGMQQAREFMERYSPDMGWCILDQRGKFSLKIKKLKIDIHSPFGREAQKQKRPKSEQLFSDLNRWMLKILLLSNVKAELWGGPKDHFFSADQLRKLAGVSLDKAYRFIRMLEKKDFLRKSPDGFKLVREKQLMDLWFSEERLRPPLRSPVRSIFGKIPNLSKVANAKELEFGGLVGGFSACKSLGVLHAPVDSLAVHIKIPIDQFLERYSLEFCEENHAHLHLIQSKHVESIFRGAVNKYQIRVVDVFQAGLDVVNFPARGLEQAQHIAQSVLDGRSY